MVSNKARSQGSKNIEQDAKLDTNRQYMKRVTFRKLGQMGRLGNQMFQIAATIGTAKKHGAAFYFKSWPYNKYLKNPVPTSRFVNIRPWSVYEESYYTYAEIPPAPVSLSLIGFFQSEKYFKHCKQEIRKYFTLKKKWVKYINKKYPQLKEKTCAIHVRRGDYVDYPDYHPPQPLSYYENAVKELFGKNFKYIHFVVCSDDIGWCKNNLKFPKMTFVEGENDIIDMYIMSMCGDNVISNSSFSWWSAWLNQNQNKVVAPNNWFGPKKPQDTKDLYCDHWIRL